MISPLANFAAIFISVLFRSHCIRMRFLFSFFFVCFFHLGSREFSLLFRLSDSLLAFVLYLIVEMMMIIYLFYGEYFDFSASRFFFGFPFIVYLFVYLFDSYLPPSSLPTLLPSLLFSLSSPPPPPLCIAPPSSLADFFPLPENSFDRIDVTSFSCDWTAVLSRSSQSLWSFSAR
jgi:hypothetical protein